MFYYLYQITNLVNNKIYVGVHRTKDLNDGYMGSGKVIKRAIEKHGTGNFRKDILETFENAEAMYAREKEIVTDKFLAREDVYNLRRGGTGGFDFINAHPEKYLTEKRMSALFANNAKRAEAWKQKYQTDENFRLQCRQNLKKAYQKSAELYPDGAFKGKHHSCETKRKMSITAKERLKDPTKNSQFGTMWITNKVVNKKIKKTEQIPEGWYRGRLKNMR